MVNLDIPFNLTLLHLTDDVVKNIKPVTVLDRLATGTTNFHEDGLFSTEIFGKVGDEARNIRFSYIDAKLEIFHPLIYNALVGMKQLYAEIMAGKEQAIWDDTVKDFVKAPKLVGGSTGFAFFLSHWKDIEFEDTGSKTRSDAITLIQKYKAIATTTRIVVIPAALRDMEIDNGRIKEDEINAFYRRIISISNTVSLVAIKGAAELLDGARYNMQITFNNISNYLKSMVKGKKKMVTGKWGSRRIFDGTRNVISAMNEPPKYLGDPGGVSANHTIIGLYQGLKSILPVSQYHIRNTYLSKIFVTPNQPVNLVDIKTKMKSPTLLKPQIYDYWTTNEGIEKLLTKYGNPSIRHQPVIVDGKYLALVYRPKHNRVFKVISGIDELPEGYSPDDTYPITYTELLYLSTYRVTGNYPGVTTRYPVTGIGSIYPSYMYIKTTIIGECRKELDDNWQVITDVPPAIQYPVFGGEFVNTMIPHPTKLEGLGGDHDGDTSSWAALVTDDALEENAEYFNSKRAYIGTDGKLVNSAVTDTYTFAIYNWMSD